MVMIRSPYCGYNLACCVELKNEDLWSYSHKIELGAYLVYENVHTITSLPIKRRSKRCYSNQHFSLLPTIKMAAKTSWYRYGTKLRHCHPMYNESRAVSPMCSKIYVNKKLSYRRVTARCVLSVVILPITTQQCRNYLYDKS